MLFISLACWCICFENIEFQNVLIFLIEWSIAPENFMASRFLNIFITENYDSLNKKIYVCIWKNKIKIKENRVPFLREFLRRFY